MLQEAADLQKNAVDELLRHSAYKREITFKAPTGSGKTYMMADFMNRVLREHPNIVFLVSTLSKGDLASQNYAKFCEYSGHGDFPALQPYLITSETAGEEELYIPLGFNVYLLPRDLYKKGGKLMQGAMEKFLYSLTGAPGKPAKKIYLIKDECHIATNNLDTLSEKNFEKIFNFSATPNLRRGQNPDVEIKDIDAVQACLIKHIEFGGETDTVADAIRKFEEIKGAYRNLLGINPCLIIQISNKDKADYELSNVIFPELNKAEHQDLKWMLIVDDAKSCDTNDIFKAKKLPVSKWKEYAKQNTATIDVIIFKMVISEGWDIPRACMLYQVRDTKSVQLDEQVMGRVRRNPRLLDFETLSEPAKRLATTAWIWGIVPEERKKVIAVKLADDGIAGELRVKTTKLKPLTAQAGFCLQDILDAQPAFPAYSNIFSLYRKLNKTGGAIKEMCYAYADTPGKWRRFTECLDSIVKENNKFVCDYSQSMEVCKDDAGETLTVSFPPTSLYTDNGNYVNIGDWVWQRRDEKDKFSFDSDAEREWADILKCLSLRFCAGGTAPNKFLWGKNYIYNSEIRYEYYLDGIHVSYPDFIMQDPWVRIHIFEVKSLNISSGIAGTLDSEQYNAKIEALKKCYRQASALTGHIFYIPVLKDDIWFITQYIGGDERTITKEQFIEFVLNQNAGEAAGC